MSLRDLNVAILRLLELNIVQVYNAGDYICIHLLLCKDKKDIFCKSTWLYVYSICHTTILLCLGML